jgi:hypothetical protein
VAANIAEGFRKRQYPKMFVSKLADADGEATETQVWLDFARDCKYLPVEKCTALVKEYEEVGRMLGSMMATPGNSYPGPNAANNHLPPTAFCQLNSTTYTAIFRMHP